MSKHLSRKQQKSQAFKTKQKAKKKGETIPEDVPEQDLIEEGDDIDGEASGSQTAQEGKVSGGSKGKGKAKGEDEVTSKTTNDEPEGSETKSKNKKKVKTAWDDEEEGEAKKTKKDIKQRFILFVGNLSYTTSREAIQAHFTEAVGYKPAVRLLTTKATPKAPAQSRGIAFLELGSSTDLQACLKLHGSILQHRKINVELTAGGGGKSSGRKEKIKERNERVGGQRQRRAEKEAEAAGEGGGDGVEGGIELQGGTLGETGDSHERKRKREVGAEEDQAMVNGKKVRGGRRVKAKGPGSEHSQAPRRQDHRHSDRPPQHGYQSQGRPNRSAQGQNHGGRGGRRPFGLTGANAVQVG